MKQNNQQMHYNVPRRIRRRIARAKMVDSGLRHLNDRDRLLGKSYFAQHWQDWVIGVPRRKAGA